MMSHIRETSQKTTQILFTPLLKLLLLPITKRHNHHLTLQNDQPYLLVANHVRGIDPFVICGSLPYRTLWRLLPLNFMTKNIFYNATKPLAWLFGCFPARAQQSAKYYGVDGSIKLLDEGFSILIFPQGKCIKPGMADVPAHSGVTRIHQARPHIPLLLCRISYHGLAGIWRGHVFSVHYQTAMSAHYTDPNDLLREILAIGQGETK